MRRAAVGVAALVMLAMLGGRALAVSDGNYRWQNQHCAPYANSFDAGAQGGGDNTAEVGCHTVTVTVSDNSGHEYFGIGLQQTKDNERGTLYPVASHVPLGLGGNVHQEDLWYDVGQGCTRFVFDSNVPTNAPAPSPTAPSCPWMNPKAPNHYSQFDAKPKPASGIRIYFGADDNTADGEHDSAYALQDGPSDGGGWHVALDPASVRPWLLAFMDSHPKYVLRHPLPAGDAGVGFCADGLCLSAQTQRQVAYQGGGQASPDPGPASPDPYPGGYPYAPGTNHDDAAPRDAAQYGPHTYDKPKLCDSDGDHPKYCGSGGMVYWHDQHGTVYDEPGVQIYNDPDPDGDSGDGIYPHPGIYIGTCGVVFGAKARPGSSVQQPPWQMPASPFTSPEGQIVIPTGCSGGSPAAGHVQGASAVAAPLAPATSTRRSTGHQVGPGSRNGSAATSGPAASQTNSRLTQTQPAATSHPATSRLASRSSRRPVPAGTWALLLVLAVAVGAGLTVRGLAV